MFFLKLKNTFDKLDLTALFFVFLAIKFFLSWLFGQIIYSVFPNKLSHPLSEAPAYEFFTAIVLFAPIFETFIFQFLFFYLGEKLKLKSSFIVIISAVLFAISHHTSLAYIVLTLFSGLFYNIIYLKIKNKYKAGIAFLFIVGIHALYNFVVWLNLVFLK
ncbi:CPBP family intramembrane metalloprotease [Sphingobacteriaceae bacterium WQ 2009]|uniref:CPBP family intramembrane metalloprotease n=1 Tax=Rhinopithecimicrobium faecis TaxID=2820698 RepID=A0A8T4HEP0_9SPHI|nr:CPBP family intramembrane metalloprotease [Sphingobacteriaceae bacterium WQ 2009]